MKSNHRDVDFLEIDSNRFLVTACDSCGAIGLKENDVVKVPYNITGKLTTRVCLMEILSIGAKPIGLTVNICNEPTPTGDEILKGIREELIEIGLDIPISISTEKNMKTSMTALGITGIGIVKKHELLINKVNPGDLVYVAGLPSVGNEVLENMDLIANTYKLKKFLNIKNIKELIPIGSSGIKGELDKMEKNYNLAVSYNKDISLDLNKTAGPSTAMIIICRDILKTSLDIPIEAIGKIV